MHCQKLTLGPGWWISAGACCFNFDTCSTRSQMVFWTCQPLCRWHFRSTAKHQKFEPIDDSPHGNGVPSTGFHMFSCSPGSPKPEEMASESAEWNSFQLQMVQMINAENMACAKRPSSGFSVASANILLQSCCVTECDGDLDLMIMDDNGECNTKIASLSSLIEKMGFETFSFTLSSDKLGCCCLDLLRLKTGGPTWPRLGFLFKSALTRRLF